MNKETTLEQVTFHTVPATWTFYVPDAPTTLRKVVGFADASGREAWMPAQAKGYGIGDYTDGYSKDDVSTEELKLEKDMAERFWQFFSHNLLKLRWHECGRVTAERYDCHWFAFWLKGLVCEDDSLSDSLQIAEYITENCPVADFPISPGRVGVIGGKSNFGTFAEHSFVGLPGGDALHVTGINEKIALTAQDETVRAYNFLSLEAPYAEPNSFGVRAYGVPAA